MRIIIVLCLLLPLTLIAGTQEQYLKKFQQYQNFKEDFPTTLTPNFVAFLNEDSPLNNKLRKKFLYHTAKNQNWHLFSMFYRGNEETTLKCYSLHALHALGNEQHALTQTEEIWLSGQSQPSSCDLPFKRLMANSQQKNKLIHQRIILAIQQKNIGLARYLLKSSPEYGENEADLLYQIHRDPQQISKLNFNQLHSDFYLYGMKRLAVKNMEKAIYFWEHAKTKQIITEKQQQEFLAYLTLYKAMRGHDDTSNWFSKIKPAFYTQSLLKWQIRYALKTHHWAQVEELILKLDNPDDLSNQYWLARALEGQKKETRAKEIYQKVSENRNYYGFLASLKLNKPFAFEHEKSNIDHELIKPYEPVLNQIKDLYQSNKIHSASILVNDFVTELPKEEKSSLAHWLANDIYWHDKALYISNNEVLHDQIALRFPLAYKEFVHDYAKRYQLTPEFVFAIIRQESTFRKNVVSHAGAYGLMQLLPKTARQMAKREKIKMHSQQQLFTPSTNINLGSAYIKYLSMKFKHHPVLVAAAYNAGPKQVRYWIKNHPPKEVDIWIETLPFYETRNYLKNVMAFYAVYQYRLNHELDISSFIKPFQ